MATRGIRVLVTLPLLVALLAWGVMLVGNGILPLAVMARPDQQVRSFVSEVLSGQATAAAQRVSRSAPQVNLQVLGLRFSQRYGAVVFNNAEIREWTPERAMVWSRVQTASGHTCVFHWTLVRERGQWVISDYGNLGDLVPDVPGL